MDLLKIQSPKQQGYMKTGYEMLLHVIFNNTIINEKLILYTMALQPKQIKAKSINLVI